MLPTALCCPEYHVQSMTDERHSSDANRIRPAAETEENQGTVYIQTPHEPKLRAK